eukprot:TRINITY_DN689_c0_g2_i1.p1 TRINITY_DN689_c0_g2~~TRINITY_DN689_c0_g2_i1.p1  ORF type:complete len:444 (-),score=127.26 TRINITY_DN689_c0_g2_i1:55-1362(-)
MATNNNTNNNTNNSANNEKDMKIFLACFKSLPQTSSRNLPTDAIEASRALCTDILRLCQNRVEDLLKKGSILKAIGLLLRRETRREYFNMDFAHKIIQLVKDLKYRQRFCKNKQLLLGLNEIARCFDQNVFSQRHIEELYPVDKIDGNRIILGRKLGEGATATVFLADFELERSSWFNFFRRATKVQVAVKIIRDINYSEIFLSSAIQHNSFLKFYAFSQCENDQTLVMEYAQHGCLKDFVKQSLKTTGIPNNVKKQILIQFFEGLAYLHDLNIVHRDLKLENCMIVEREGGNIVCCITDLGSAKALGRTLNAVTVAGTALFHAPEIFTISEEVNNNTDSVNKVNSFASPSDIYPSGYIIFAITELKIPYDGLENSRIALLKANDALQRLNIPSSINISNNNCCKGLIENCWRFNSNERNTAKQILEQLKTINFN